MADLRMDAIGEIDWYGALRQVYDIAARREYEHLIGEYIDLQGLEIFLRIAEIMLQIDHLTQP